MKNCFECSYTFSKIKLHITMSLSTLVSTLNGFLLNDANLRNSLKTMLTYLTKDLNLNKNSSLCEHFANQVTF